MRFCIGIAAVFLAVAMVTPMIGCGGSDSVASFEAQDPRFATVTEDEGDAKPKIDPPNRPPPKKTLARDIEVGSGPVANRGDWIAVNYLGINYKTGKQQYHHWPPLPPLEFKLGFGGNGEAWEEGIEGMRVGGRRELIIPSRLLYKTGTIDYVVDLVRVKPGPAEP